MKKTFIICFILFFAHELSAEINFPGNNFVEGWKKSKKTLRFEKMNLFDHINGGAEIFLEFGFEELLVQKYQKGETEIVAEVYRMECPESALGIYLMKCGNETSDQNIAARNTTNQYQSTIVKGSCFILINNFSGDKTLLPVMTTLSNQILSSIPEGNSVELFQDLPRENFIIGSELIIRGPYALQPIYTFGEGDIFQLGGKIFGVVADYQDENNNIYTQILIKYPDRESAALAFKNVIENLDPYLKILDKWEYGFSFKDFQNKFGRIEVKNCVIEIKIKISET